MIGAPSRLRLIRKAASLSRIDETVWIVEDRFRTEKELPQKSTPPVQFLTKYGIFRIWSFFEVLYCATVPQRNKSTPLVKPLCPDRIWDMYLARTVTFSLFSLRNTALSHCQNSILQVSPNIFLETPGHHQCFDILRMSAHSGERQCQVDRMLCTCAGYHTHGICVRLLTACPLGRS